MTNPEEFKAKAIEKLSKIKCGSKTESGQNVKWVYLKADEYVIYEVESKDLSNSIRVSVEPWTEDDKNNREGNFFKISATYVEMKGLLYKVFDEANVKSRLASLIGLAINGDVETATEGFKLLRDEINKTYENLFKNRIRYLATVLFFAVLFSILSCTVYYCNVFDDKHINKELIYVITAGTIGGFISVSRRIKQMVFDKDVNKYLYIFNGLERVALSAFGAIISYFMIQSSIVFGFISELNESTYGMIVLSFLAGFSETLIPNLLIKLENKHSD